jgi:hypothetical protein
VNDLFWAKKVDTGDTGTVGTNVYGLRKFDKFRARNIGPTNENWNLKAEAGRTASWRGFQALLLLQNIDPHEASQGWYQGTSTNTSISDARHSVFDEWQSIYYELITWVHEGKGRQEAREGPRRSTSLPQMCKWNGFTIDRRRQALQP